MGNTFSAWRLGLARKAGTRPRLARGEFSRGVDDAKLDGSVVNLPAAIVGDLAQTHWLADQGFTEEDQLVAPFDLAVRPHPPHHMIGCVFGLEQAPAVGPRRRRMVMAGRRRLPKSLMRPL